MTEHAAQLESGMGIADAIIQLRNELLRARASGVGQPVQLPVDSMTVELRVMAERDVEGKAGLRVPIVNLEVGAAAGWRQEHLHTVTIVFGGPVDQTGMPVRIASNSDELKG